MTMIVKINELLGALTEARSEPFPVRQISNSEWLIDTGGLGDVSVILDSLVEKRYTILHVSFKDSGGYSANNQMGSAANKVLWTVISVLENVTPPDLFVFYPADSNEAALAKKTSIYGKLLLALRRGNTVIRTGTTTYTNFAKVFWAMPIGSKARPLDDSDVQTIIEQAVTNKLDPAPPDLKK